MWLEYMRERFGYLTIENDVGFVCYTIRPPFVALEEIYINREHRRLGKGTEFLVELSQIGKAHNCTHIWAQVFAHDKNAPSTLMASFRSGFEMAEAKDGRIVLIKEIGE